MYLIFNKFSLTYFSAEYLYW